MKEKVFKKQFRGTIDALLAHTASADADAVEANVEYENAVASIMRDFAVERDEAERMLNEAHLQMVQQTLDSLVKKGLAEVSEYNSDGEPLYVLTEKGKRIKKSIV